MSNRRPGSDCCKFSLICCNRSVDAVLEWYFICRFIFLELIIRCLNISTNNYMRLSQRWVIFGTTLTKQCLYSKFQLGKKTGFEAKGNDVLHMPFEQDPPEKPPSSSSPRPQRSKTQNSLTSMMKVLNKSPVQETEARPLSFQRNRDSSERS